MSASAKLVEPSKVATYNGPPVFLFLGTSTAGSSVHQMFSRWSPAFDPEAQVRGVDIPVHANPEVFRRLVADIADNPHIRGAVITSHKVRVHAACHDLFDSTSPLVDLAREVNSIRSTDGLHAFATDPVAIELVRPDSHTTSPVVCLGSGGSAVALVMATVLDMAQTAATGKAVPKGTAQRDITIVARRYNVVPELEALFARLPDRDRIQVVVAADEMERSQLTAAQPPGTLVANATGLGKIEAASPVTGPEAFPAESIAWDFNYRGPLTFLAQARVAGVHVVDGWDYYLAAWSTALAAITNKPTAQMATAIRQASAEFRPGSSSAKGDHDAG